MKKTFYIYFFSQKIENKQTCHLMRGDQDLDWRGMTCYLIEDIALAYHTLLMHLLCKYTPLYSLNTYIFPIIFLTADTRSCLLHISIRCMQRRGLGKELTLLSCGAGVVWDTMDSPLNKYLYSINLDKITQTDCPQPACNVCYGTLATFGKCYR